MIKRPRSWLNCARSPKASPASNSRASNRNGNASVVLADRKEMPNPTVCCREPFEKSGRLRRGVTTPVAARRIATGKLAGEQPQRELVIDIVPLGERRHR